MIDGVGSQNMENHIARELKEKIANPLVYQRSEAPAGTGETHLYDVTILIDVGNAI